MVRRTAHDRRYSHAVARVGVVQRRGQEYRHGAHLVEQGGDGKDVALVQRDGEGGGGLLQTPMATTTAGASGAAARWRKGEQSTRHSNGHWHKHWLTSASIGIMAAPAAAVNAAAALASGSGAAGSDASSGSIVIATSAPVPEGAFSTMEMPVSTPAAAASASAAMSMPPADGASIMPLEMEGAALPLPVAAAAPASWPLPVEEVWKAPGLAAGSADVPAPPPPVGAPAAPLPAAPGAEQNAARDDDQADGVAAAASCAALSLEVMRPAVAVPVPLKPPQNEALRTFVPNPGCGVPCVLPPTTPAAPPTDDNDSDAASPLADRADCGSDSADVAVRSPPAPVASVLPRRFLSCCVRVSIQSYVTHPCKQHTNQCHNEARLHTEMRTHQRTAAWRSSNAPPRRCGCCRRCSGGYARARRRRSSCRSTCQCPRPCAAPPAESR